MPAAASATRVRAVGVNSPFSLAGPLRQAAKAFSSSKNPCPHHGADLGVGTASDATIITVKQPRGPASPDGSMSSATRVAVRSSRLRIGRIRPLNGLVIAAPSVGAVALVELLI